MPLPLPQIEVSFDDFRVMPHRLGWKHEYWDGMARLSPNHSAVTDLVADLRRFTQPVAFSPQPPAEVTIQPVQLDDRDELLRLHRAAFEQDVQYAGYSEADYAKEITRSIDGYYRARRTDLLGQDPYSCVAKINDRVIGAILIVACAEGMLTIQPVMVDTVYRRKGIATTLLHHATRALARDGVARLYSCCHLSNDVSLRWHQAMGFRRQLTWLGAAHLARHHAQNSEHHRHEAREILSRLHAELADAYQQLHDTLWQNEATRVPFRP